MMDYSDVYVMARQKQAEARDKIMETVALMRDLRHVLRDLRGVRSEMRDTANRALAESYEREITDAR